MKRIISWISILLILCLVFSACGVDGGEDSPKVTTPKATKPAQTDAGSLTILFTGGARDVFARDLDQGQIGYAALTAYRDALVDAGESVILVDGGNALVPKNEHGDARELWELVETVGYDVRVPGNLELSQGIYAFQSRQEAFRGSHWIGCCAPDENLVPYVVLEVGAARLGIVGVSAAFAGKDAQLFYDAVQTAVDAAMEDGADYVICVGNLGTDPANSPFTAPELIAHTTGYAACLDSGSETVVEGTWIRDKDDFEIPLVTTGYNFLKVGKITLDLKEGSVQVELLQELTEEDDAIAKKAEELLRAREPADADLPETE